MTDFFSTPLSDEEVAFLVTIGVQFYTDHKTGKIYISKRWWNGVTNGKRNIIDVILTHWRSKADAKPAA